MPKIILDGYPQSEGAKMGSVVELAGPASYASVVTGSPPTGGQAITARQFGLKYIEHVSGELSDDGQYFVMFTPKVKNRLGVTAGILLWFIANTGVQVTATTDLSARTVRLRAIGLD